MCAAARAHELIEFLPEKGAYSPATLRALRNALTNPPLLATCARMAYNIVDKLCIKPPTNTREAKKDGGAPFFDATRVLYGFALGREVKITEVQRTCGSVLKLARDDSAPDRGAKK